MLAFLDPLLGRATTVVKVNHALGSCAPIGHDETDSRKEFAAMPLDLGNHPTRPLPTGGLILEVGKPNNLIKKAYPSKFFESLQMPLWDGSLGRYGHYAHEGEMKMRGRKIPSESRDLFIKHLKQTCNVSASAVAAGLSRSAIYYTRERDEEFAEEWDSAIGEAIDMLESEARRRAVDGFEEPVYYKGVQVGAVRKYSDRMLELLLKGHLPEKYKDRVQHSGDVKVNVTEQALLEARQRASQYRN